MSNLRKAIDELTSVQDEEDVISAVDLVETIRLNLISICDDLESKNIDAKNDIENLNKSEFIDLDSCYDNLNEISKILY